MVTRERTSKHDARVKKSSGATAAASARATTPARQLVNPPLIIVVASATPVALVYLLTNFPMPAAAAMVLIAFVATVMFSRRIREQQEQLWRTDAVPAQGNVSFTDTDAARTPIGLSTGDSTEVQAARRKERAQPELGRGRADFSTGKIALHSATGAGQDVPLLIMLISLIAAIYLLENLPFLVAAMGIIALGILNTVIFARRNRQPLDPGNVSFTEDADAVPQPIGQETGLSAEAQAARQPAFSSAASAPQSAPQLQWTLARHQASQGTGAFGQLPQLASWLEPFHREAEENYEALRRTQPDFSPAHGTLCLKNQR